MSNIILNYFQINKKTPAVSPPGKGKGMKKNSL